MRTIEEALKELGCEDVIDEGINSKNKDALLVVKDAMRRASRGSFSDTRETEDRFYFDVRYWGEWEVSDNDRNDPDNDESDFEDWDWKVLTTKWVKKFEEIIADVSRRYNVKFNTEVGEKNSIYVAIKKAMLEEVELEEETLGETYTDKELDAMVGKVFNIQKVDSIFRRTKYGDKKLFAHTVCTKCGREKSVFLSNLVKDPDKYGSCVCSDTNIDAKIDNIDDLYSGHKKLKSNTSGYTGVSFVKTYKGEPYNKWRAYIEVDGVRTYLGDFTSKSKAIKARKEAGEKGIKWYKDNRNKLMRDVRRRSKKYTTSKYRETQKVRRYKKAK